MFGAKSICRGGGKKDSLKAFRLLVYPAESGTGSKKVHARGLGTSGPSSSPSWNPAEKTVSQRDPAPAASFRHPKHCAVLKISITERCEMWVSVPFKDALA